MRACACNCLLLRFPARPLSVFRARAVSRCAHLTVGAWIPRATAARRFSDMGAMEVEDVYAEIGGLGRYQLWHMGVLVQFWFFNVRALKNSLFACKSSVHV